MLGYLHSTSKHASYRERSYTISSTTTATRAGVDGVLNLDRYSYIRGALAIVCFFDFFFFIILGVLMVVFIDLFIDMIPHSLALGSLFFSFYIPVTSNQEPTETSKQPIRTSYLDHVTGYQPIMDLYFLIRSVHASNIQLTIIYLLDRLWIHCFTSSSAYFSVIYFWLMFDIRALFLESHSIICHDETARTSTET
eukprot:sb/3470905/